MYKIFVFLDGYVNTIIKENVGLQYYMGLLATFVSGYIFRQIDDAYMILNELIVL